MSLAIKRLSWALAVSIGLNLFWLGFGAARWLRSESSAAHHDQHLDRGMRGGMRELLGPSGPELREGREQLIAARRQVAEALEAEPFDRTRMERALEELRATTSRGQTLLHERLLERAAKLPADERRELAKRRFLREHWPGGRGPDDVSSP